MPARKTIAAHLLAPTMFLAAMAPVHAEEPAGLPLYDSEEAATSRLEAVMLKTMETTGVTYDSMKPTEPLKEKGFVAVGIILQCSGSLEKVTALLAALVDQPFTSFPSVIVAQDRRDPATMRAKIEMRDWHAAKEKTVDKVKRWNRVAKPTPSPLELYQTCASSLADTDARITSFSAKLGTATVIGEASNAHQGRSYGAKVFANETLARYEWHWLQRPVVDARKKDGTATFRFQGKPKGESES